MWHWVIFNGPIWCSGAILVVVIKISKEMNEGVKRGCEIYTHSIIMATFHVTTIVIDPLRTPFGKDRARWGDW